MKHRHRDATRTARLTKCLLHRSCCLRSVLLLTAIVEAMVFLASPASGTSVAALIDKRNHRAVIAADCRVQHQLNSLSECKIVEKPGCTVAIAGLYREDSTGFDLRRLVDAACRHPGDLREKAEAFVRLARKPYEAAVRGIRETDLDDFQRTIEGRATEAIFAGLVSGRLTLLVRGFVPGPDGKIALERYESSDNPESSIGYIAGLNHHVQEQVKSHSQWDRLGYREAARRFVEMEINADPDLAGPPISEVEIDDRGTVHWISKGACEVRESD